VAADWKGAGKFYPGKVKSIETLGDKHVYNILYDDGDEAEEPEHRVKQHPRHHPPAAAHPNAGQAAQPAAAARPAAAWSISNIPRKAFKVGDVVAAFWDLQPTHAGWYKGKVAAVHSDGTHLIHFDDGDVKDKVTKEQIKPMVPSAAAGTEDEEPEEAQSTTTAAAAAVAARPVDDWQHVHEEAPHDLRRLQSIATIQGGKLEEPSVYQTAIRHGTLVARRLQLRKESTSGEQAAEAATLEAQMNMVVGSLQDRLEATGHVEVEEQPEEEDSGREGSSAAAAAATARREATATGGEISRNKGADMLARMIAKMRRQGAPAAQIQLMERLHRQASGQPPQPGDDADAVQGAAGTAAGTAGAGEAAPSPSGGSSLKPLQQGDRVEAKFKTYVNPNRTVTRTVNPNPNPAGTPSGSPEKSTLSVVLAPRLLTTSTLTTVTLRIMSTVAECGDQGGRKGAAQQQLGW